VFNLPLSSKDMALLVLHFAELGAKEAAKTSLIEAPKVIEEVKAARELVKYGRLGH